MPAAARLGDMDEGHECFPPTAINAGSPDVLINNIAAVREGDTLDDDICPCPFMVHGMSPRMMAEGSATVLINGLPAVRVGDAVDTGGAIAAGSGDVLIG